MSKKWNSREPAKWQREPERDRSQEPVLEARADFEIFAGPAPRVGWLLNMLPTSVRSPEGRGARVVDV